MKTAIIIYIIIVGVIGILWNIFIVVGEDEATEISKKTMIEYCDREKVNCRDFKFIGTGWTYDIKSWHSVYRVTKENYDHEVLIYIDPIFRSTDVHSMVTEGPEANRGFTSSEVHEENPIE